MDIPRQPARRERHALILATAARRERHALVLAIVACALVLALVPLGLDRLWTAPSEVERTGQWHARSGWGVVRRPDGRWVAYGSVEAKARPGNAAAGQVRSRWSVVLNPDGQWLATGSVDTKVRLGSQHAR